jgi:hypothetical protein
MARVPRVRSLLLAAAVALACLFIACGDDAGPSAAELTSGPAATATSSAAATPATGGVSVEALIAVGEALYPPDEGFEVYHPCDVSDDACPLSDRLREHLTETNKNLCRCQNASGTRYLEAEVTPGGGIVHAALYGGYVEVDFVVVDEGGRLVVDDTVCRGEGEETSIYVTIQEDQGGGPINYPAPCRGLTPRFNADTGVCDDRPRHAAPGSWQTSAPRQPVGPGEAIEIGLRNKDGATGEEHRSYVFVMGPGANQTSEAIGAEGDAWLTLRYPSDFPSAVSTAGVYTLVWNSERAGFLACDGFVIVSE